jgi:hypothetical protein
MRSQSPCPPGGVRSRISAQFHSPQPTTPQVSASQSHSRPKSGPSQVPPDVLGPAEERCSGGLYADHRLGRQGDPLGVRPLLASRTSPWCQSHRCRRTSAVRPRCRRRHCEPPTCRGASGTEADGRHGEPVHRQLLGEPAGSAAHLEDRTAGLEPRRAWQRTRLSSMSRPRPALVPPGAGGTQTPFRAMRCGDRRRGSWSQCVSALTPPLARRAVRRYPAPA